MSFTKKLHAHLSSWEEKNLISHDQKVKIIDDMKQESSGLWFFKILGTIGAICIGIWVLLIIASNWGYFPKTIQLIIALLLPIVPIVFWYYFCYVQKELQTIGNVFAYLGSILIWGSIALIGQIYNTDGTVGSLLLLWLILSLPLLYVFRFKTIAVTCTALFYWVVYYYSTEVFFVSWRDEQYILALFTVISATVALLSYLGNRTTQKVYDYLLMPVAAISLKILFFCLFMATVDDYFVFLGSWITAVLLHNILFLGIIFFCMWWANKNHEILLRHATFLWLGAWMTVKYFELAWGYLHTGLFFIISGFFLIGLVYGYVKINTYLWKKDNISS